MKKIVVTGGTGYIGSHTVIELQATGFEVHIVDNLSNSDISMLDRIAEISGKRPEFTELDLREESKVVSFFRNHPEIEGVIHFAALKSVGESVQKPLHYYENNILGLTNMLKGMKMAKVKMVVFSSSATVYGSPEDLPVTESTPIGYTPSPYGATKQMCERIIEDFVHANKWSKAISLRYFNPIGAHKSCLIGELPTGIPNNLMPFITQTAAGVRKQLSVFGSDYNTSDGTAIRDYIHVSDVATAHVKAIAYLDADGGRNWHQKINIGTGKGSSVLEVVQSFERTSGKKLNYVLAERREGDVESVYADVSMAESLLKWKAIRNLDEMTGSAWEWEKKLRGI